MNILSGFLKRAFKSRLSISFSIASIAIDRYKCYVRCLSDELISFGDSYMNYKIHRFKLELSFFKYVDVCNEYE